MVPAGYLAKRVAPRPNRLEADGVSSIYSVSGYLSLDFADYGEFWKHNGYWLFDSPAIIIDLARDNDIDLTGTASEARVLEGYDVVTFHVQTSPEHSPLSCNGLAAEVATNERCLLHSFEQARALLENGTFNNSEPGPYRIFAVYSVGWPG